MVFFFFFSITVFSLLCFSVFHLLSPFSAHAQPIPLRRHFYQNMFFGCYLLLFLPLFVVLPRGLGLGLGLRFSSERETLSLPSVLVVGWTFLESFFDPSLVRGAMAGIVDLRRLR